MEAPLSLFLQYYAAMFINEEADKFLLLCVSIMTSICGISSGVYITNHLQILEDLPETAAKPTSPATDHAQALEAVTVGVQPQVVAAAPVVPPGLGISQGPKLPPGLGPGPIQVEARTLADTE